MTPSKITRPASDGVPVRGPLGEPLDDLRRRATKILRALRKAYPDAHVPLNYENPLELLVATILAAQCTDARVNEVTPPLFAKYRTPSDWAAAVPEVLEKEIRSTGFFRNKARAIRESAEDIVTRFDGRVPDTLEQLVSLRGVGRKTANVVLAYAYGKQGIIVDTHFIRLSRRMGLTAEFEPTEIESDLARIVSQKRWSEFSLMLTWHGRTTCNARKPECERCPVSARCPAFETRGEITWKVESPGSGKRTARSKKMAETLGSQVRPGGKAKTPRTKRSRAPRRSTPQ